MSGDLGDGLSRVAVGAPIATSASVFVDADDDVRAGFTAEWVAEALADVVARQGRAVLGLVGGSSVATVHDRLREVDLDWSGVTITVADERAVPADDDRRNWRVVEPLVDPLVADGRLSSDDLVPLPDLPSDPTPDDVDEALEVLRRRVERIDVALLGLGPDGHVASLFPGHPGLSSTGSFVVVDDAPKPPPLRMSATVGMLAGADAIALVGHGDAKAEAVAAVTTEGPLAERPGRVVHLARRGVVVTDRLPRT
ncbi:6-phosphogluconolactonase [Salsipaludibacter albus]|uniref:6-phosphogluconolactonase n=1 Tax=Salsipaludibacter albus TaxID=2849650 RepID=UPI001EE495A4|nr:6-phosphogluconolactonase [Salsipaludibacter albus]MBY5164129.1 6-phosphogluconolactonase [Salsipaludibacter albus]